VVHETDPGRAAVHDVAIVVVGLTHRDEGEWIVWHPDSTWRIPGISGGGDRIKLGLRPDDVVLLERVSTVNPKTIVVLLGGSAIIAPWRSSVAAVLHAFYAGQEAGHAIAALLFGDVSPSGKLPFTVPEDEADLPDFDPTSNRAIYDLWHGYGRFEARELAIAWAFGHGLSYTTFAYGPLVLDADELSPEGTLRVTVTLENTGAMAAREVVQLYVGFGDFPVPRPPKLLRAFTKVLLNPGERIDIALEVSIADLAWFDSEIQDWRVEQRGYEVLVGGSSRDQDLVRASFRVTGGSVRGP
jgi:beta-glucosidase